MAPFVFPNTEPPRGAGVRDGGAALQPLLQRRHEIGFHALQMALSAGLGVER